MRRPAARVFVALGSNRGDRRANLEGAVECLRRAPGVRVRRVSPWFETAAVGGPPGQERYWNGVLEADCELEPRELLSLLHAVEALFGRRRAAEVRHGPRTLDLDLLFYGEERDDEDGLVVPHPRVEERAFVLAPLCALAPERALPSGKSALERLRELEDAAAAPGCGDRRR